MRLLRRLRRGGDGEYGGRAAAAEAQEQVCVSQRREERIRAKVVAPLTEAAERNQFAEMLRHSLTGDAR